MEWDHLTQAKDKDKDVAHWPDSWLSLPHWPPHWPPSWVRRASEVWWRREEAPPRAQGRDRLTGEILSPSPRESPRSGGTPGNGSGSRAGSQSSTGRTPLAGEGVSCSWQSLFCLFVRFLLIYSKVFHFLTKLGSRTLDPLCPSYWILANNSIFQIKSMFCFFQYWDLKFGDQITVLLFWNISKNYVNL